MAFLKILVLFVNERRNKGRKIRLKKEREVQVKVFDVFKAFPKLRTFCQLLLDLAVFFST
jgi:hypothetical protein